jgi:glycosyltransferase involved in cell wall biosynthesis
MLTISFIIPAYNAEKTLRECIKSIIHQDLIDCEKEIIIINNNSTDRTQEVAEEFSDVKIFFLAEKSRSEARQLGISKSKGHFFAFIDSDVALQFGWANTLLELLLKNPTIGAAQGSVIPMIEKSWHWLRWHRTRVKTHGTFIQLASVVSGSIPVVNTAASMWRKSAIGTGFDLELHRAEDIDLTMSVLQNGYSLAGTTNVNALVKWSNGIVAWFLRFYKQAQFEKIVYSKWGYAYPEVKTDQILTSTIWSSLPILFQFCDLLITIIFKCGLKDVRVRSKSSNLKTIPISHMDSKTFKHDSYYLNPECRSIILDNKICIINLTTKRCFWLDVDEVNWPRNLGHKLVKNLFIIRR